MSAASDILKLIKEKEIEFVDLRFTDPRGKLQHMTQDLTTIDEDFLKLIEGKDLSLIPPCDFPKLGRYKGRGVITTATYPARQFGVGSAMGLMKAAALCPQAILLPVDFPRYKHFSSLFKQQILSITPLMEDRGIDEVYIDFTHVKNGQILGGYELALQLQTAILTATGLTCSIGVAPNKLLAKMASEFNKPKGISIIYEEDLASKIWPLECRKINGIGHLGLHRIAVSGLTKNQRTNCPNGIRHSFFS